MGEIPSNQPVRSPEYEGYPQVDKLQAPAGSGMPDGVPFHAQFSGLAQQQRADAPRQHQHGLATYNMPAHQVQGGSFNMNSMANSLPDYVLSQPSQRLQSGGSSSSLRGPQYSAAGPFGGHYTSAQFSGPSMDGTLDASAGQQAQRHGSIGAAPSTYSPYGQQLPQYFYPAAQFNPQAQQSFFTAAGQNVSMYDRRTSMGSLQGMPAGYVGNYQSQGLGRTMAGLGNYGDMYATTDGHQRAPSEGGMSSVPRGPPRKPKQSGHALWVGNLPPGTTVLDLKDHFSRDATKDIESLFLISKSNCAFVNYRTEASCTAAMQRFHDSRFQGVRLVCRLRRSSAQPAGVPSGPSAMFGSTSTSVTSPTPEQSPLTSRGPGSSLSQPETDGTDGVAPEVAPGEKVQEKFFIVKSLTLQDLELSVRNGIWATQAHNEKALNKAYESAENVYLIFSANKSGEYFGYARMISPISEDAKEVLGTIPRHEPTVEVSDVPRTIPTPATEFAPKGHIIDDMARGTIFWEADHSDEESEDEAKPPTDGEEDAAGGPHTWGKPFKIEWVSTNRLPFYRTRGLRNPWNANREVKIARDGTELEPSVGNRLVQMFHRMGQPPPPQMPQMGMPGMPPHMGGPGIRSYN